MVTMQDWSVLQEIIMLLNASERKIRLDIDITKTDLERIGSNS